MEVGNVFVHSHEFSASSHNSLCSCASQTIERDDHLCLAPVSSGSRGHVLRVREGEKDPKIHARRLKQLQYGWNTIGYRLYRQSVPRHLRISSLHPQTPDRHRVMSRRCWDGLVRVWRRDLHVWDPVQEPCFRFDRVKRGGAVKRFGFQS
uniref:oocyte-specific histone RNA stem-loop-binding protein 2-like isoform X2 n=1 Tax=Myxine glutinosa TaxID=7769 RepID=UPI00358F24A6